MQSQETLDIFVLQSKKLTEKRVTVGTSKAAHTLATQ